MNLVELLGREFGPARLQVTSDAVADFVAATGDDPDRWGVSAPPGFVSVALFAVAPELLGFLYDHSVIHGEQTYVWLRPIEVGSVLELRGVVTKVRERSGTYFITFDLDVDDGSGTVSTGSALFLAGDEGTTASSEERPEPAATDPGPVSSGHVSASRSDLIRYAAATRDWNPIHWDHDSAVAAGLPGVVVHGLLQASWVFREASRGRVGDRPLARARVRFRSPLLPATPVSMHIEDGRASLSDGETEYISATIEYGDE